MKQLYLDMIEASSSEDEAIDEVPTLSENEENSSSE